MEQVIERGGSALHHFALLANFELPPDSSQVQFVLELERNVVDEVARCRIFAVYEEAPRALARAREAAYDAKDLLPAADRARLVAWNRTGRPYQECGLATAFAWRAQATPEVGALVQGEEVWSYAELEYVSNRVARALAQRGVGCGDLVGVHLERSPEPIVTFLAVLKLGAAYVPLDLADPRARLEQILGASRPRLVVTHAAQRARLGAGIDTMALDNEAHLVARQAPEVIACEVSPDALAYVYVMYTSGSTGTPKGVG